MKKNVSALAALAILASQSGQAMEASPTIPVDMDQLAFMCLLDGKMLDRTLLQEELTRLLETNPDSICIDLIVAQLGGSPVGELTAAIDSY